MSANLEHHRARVSKKIDLHYVKAGAGSIVLLLHGWPQTWYQWRKVIPLLAPHYTVVAPDLRGFGESAKPLSGYDKRTVAEDIWGLVQHLGFATATVVGHDIGGGVAYAFAAAHRDNTRGIAIIDVAITIDELEQLGYYKRNFHLSFNATPDIAVALVSGRERMFFTHFYRNCYNPGAFTHEDIDEYVAAFSAPGALRASMAHYGALGQDLKDNQENAKVKLKMPVLALGGSHSFGERTMASCQQVAEDVEGAVIEGCAHWVSEEQPERLCDRLLPFLERIHAKGDLGSE